MRLMQLWGNYEVKLRENILVQGRRHVIEEALRRRKVTAVVIVVVVVALFRGTLATIVVTAIAPSI